MPANLSQKTQFDAIIDEPADLTVHPIPPKIFRVKAPKPCFCVLLLKDGFNDSLYNTHLSDTI